VSEINQNYKLDVLIVFIAIVLAVTSLVFDISKIQLFFDEPVYWFQRSGCIMVLSAVCLEFRQLLVPVEQDELKSLGGLHLGYVMSKQKDGQKTFQIIALFLSIFGTGIWGYGDLFFKT